MSGQICRTEKIMRIIAAIAGVILTIASMVWALATQNQKLEVNCTEVKMVKEKVDIHDKTITQIETKLDYISKGVDEIRKEIKKP